MSQPFRVDRAFGAGPFLVRDALAAGHSQKALDHPRWHRPFRGVRSKQAPTTLLERALQYVPRLRPGERFSHATALALLGCPIRVPVGQAIDVTAPPGTSRARSAGVLGHAPRAEAPAYTVRAWGSAQPVPINHPLTAVLEAATQLPLRELVVALDHLLLVAERDGHDADNLAAELRSYAEAATGRGTRLFRLAASLARCGAESRMETLLRLAGVRVGAPDFVLQHEVRDSSGRWIGRFDAAEKRSMSLFEFDGEQHHFSRRQRRRDPKKLQAAMDAGWRVKVFYAEDLIGDLVPAGLAMLRFCGASPRRVPVELQRAIDDDFSTPTEPAIPLPDMSTRHQR